MGHVFTTLRQEIQGKPDTLSVTQTWIRHVASALISVSRSVIESSSMWTFFFFFLHRHIDIWMLVTLFKATNQPIGLCSAILSLCHLTVNGIKKMLLFSRGRFVKGFSSFVKIFNLAALQKKNCTVCTSADFCMHSLPDC